MFFGFNPQYGSFMEMARQDNGAVKQWAEKEIDKATRQYAS
jgi:hypothetical protein